MCNTLTISRLNSPAPESTTASFSVQVRNNKHAMLDHIFQNKSTKTTKLAHKKSQFALKEVQLSLNEALAKVQTETLFYHDVIHSGTVENSDSLCLVLGGFGRRRSSYSRIS